MKESKRLQIGGGKFSLYSKLASWMLVVTFALTTQTTWADTYPEYITDICVVGGSASEAESAASYYENLGYTIIRSDLNAGCGSKTDYVWIGYKKSSTASVNGGYITDIVVDHSSGSSETKVFSNITYNRAPCRGGSWFQNSVHGDLNSHAGGDDIHIYYTRHNFNNKRVVNGISIDNNGNNSVGGDLNAGAGGDYVYMHISTTTKTNRVVTEPVLGATLITGSVNVIEKPATTTEGTVYYRLGTSGDFTEYPNQLTVSSTGTYTVQYYVSSDNYGNQSAIQTKKATVTKKAYNSSLGAYEISSVSDLRALAACVNAGNSCSGLTFTQTCDIDFAPGDDWKNSTAHNFNGIGYYYENDKQSGFEGTYDGQGYSITGIRLYIDTDIKSHLVSGSYSYKGLFGLINEGGTVKNVVLKESSIVAYGVFGGIAGYNDGTIENCYVKNIYINSRLLEQQMVNAGDFGFIAGVSRGTLKHNYYYNCQRANDYAPTKVGCDRADVTVNDGATYIWEGQGSYASPYFIASSSGWELLADMVAGGETFDDKVFCTLSSFTARRTVGASASPFKGRYVGRYGYVSPYTITAAIDNTAASQALFAYIEDAEICDLVVNGSVSGGIHSAALVGHATGTNSIYNVHVGATITAKGAYCGGIVGHAKTSTTTIKDCVFTGSILGGTHVGVICGWADSGCNPTIQNCLEFGSSYTGTNVNPIGLISSWGTVTNSYYKNAQKGSPSQNTTRGKQAYVVTLANGINVSGAGLTYNGTLYMGSGDVVTLSYSGAGQTEGYASNGFYATAGTVSGTTYTMAAANTSISTSFTDVWGVAQGCNGSAAKPYTITTTKGLDLLALNVNNGNTYESRYFQLGANIAYEKSLTNNYTPIGKENNSFKGTFDGKNFTISGIRISTNYDSESDRYKGVFGTTDNGCVIKNLHLADIQMQVGSYSGTVVGTAYAGTIRNCYVHNDVILKPSTYSVYYLGGIVGQSWEVTVENCVSAVQMSLPGSSAPNGFGGITGCIRSKNTTIRNNIAVGANINTYNSRGIIAGKKDANNYTLENNYYAGCSIQGATSNIGLNMADVTADDGAVPALRDGADNSTAIALLAAMPTDFKPFNVALNSRTLYKDGYWNTLCLPFNVDLTDSNSPLYGATVRRLSGAEVTNNGKTLRLTFADAGNTLTAGTPYFIKWGSSSNITEPTFSGRTITSTTPGSVSFTANGYTVEFLGTYSPATLVANTADNLFIGSNSKLHYPTQDGYQVNAFRAYFKINRAGASAKAFTNFVIDFGDGDIEESATGITTTDYMDYMDSSAFGWYSIDGCPLNGKPTAKGIYIYNGKKVVLP